MRVSCADLCESYLVHISHRRCWLEEFTSVPRLHRPLCDPCCQPAFPGLLIPSKPLAPLPRGVLSLTLLAAIQCGLPPHLTSQLPSLAHCSRSWYFLRPPFPLTPNPLHFLLPPELLLSWTPTSNSLSSPGFLPPAKYLCELLSSSQLPHAHHLTALWVLAGFLQTLLLPIASPLVSHV